MAAMTSVANDLFDMWSASDQVGVQVQVSILNFLQLDTHVIRTPIARAIILLKKVFKTYKNGTAVSSQTKFPNDIFYTEICHRHDKLVIGPCAGLLHY